MTTLRTLCVYCGSSNRVAPQHLEAASELGRRSAERGVGIVFGGGKVGLMGKLADGALAAGGQVTGIIPQHLQDWEVGHDGIQKMEVVGSMHTRKARMCVLSDAFCVLPGGLGTLDETFEIVTWRQLRLHDKPIVIVNLDGFWDPLCWRWSHTRAKAATSAAKTRRSIRSWTGWKRSSTRSTAAPDPRHPLDSSLL